MAGRGQIFVLVAGIPGSGKSSIAKKLIEANSKVGKPSLIVIPDDEEQMWWEYDELEIDEDILNSVLNTDRSKIKPEDLPEYEKNVKYIYRCFREHKSGVKKVYCNNPKLFSLIKGEKKKGSPAQRAFWGGLIVLDDARTYLKGRDEPFRVLTMRRRQMNCDILFLCHGFSEFPRSCNSYITDVILFQTLDDYETWNIANKKMFQPIVERINSQAKTNKHYNERIILRSTLIEQ